MVATSKSRTTSGTVPFRNIVSVVAHFTTMAATDTIQIRDGSSGGAIVATLQPAANNQSAYFTPGVPVVLDVGPAYVLFNGTAAGDVSVAGF